MAVDLDYFVRKLGEQEVIQLTDAERSGTVNTERLDEAINAATATLRSYLGTRYTWPLADAALPFLDSMVFDLAHFDLYEDFAEADEMRYKVLKNARDVVIAFGKDVVAGKATLPSPLLPVQPDAAGDVILPNLRTATARTVPVW